MLVARFLTTAFLVFSFSSISFASSIIELSDHTISYESGFIDAETLNGNAKNVVIKQKSRRGGTVLIETYSLNSSTEGKTTIIESLNITGLTTITPDQELITVEDLSWSGGKIDGNWMDFMIQGGEGENPLFTNLGVITANNMTVSENGKTIFVIDSVFLNSADMPNNPYQNLPISDLSFEFRNIFIPADAGDDDDFVQGMKAMGLDGLRFSVALSGKNVLVDDRINTNATLFLSAEKMVDIRMSVGIGTSDLILSELDRMVAFSDMEDIADMYIELMMVGMFFNNMDVIISDKGILEVLIEDYASQLGVTREQAVSIMMDSVASAIGVAAPNTYREIAPHIRGFLTQGGTLYTGLNPSQPVPAASLFGIIAIPDQAKDLLGLSMNHQP